MTPEEHEKLLDGPALKPPLGVRPNFDNPPDLALLAFGLIIAVLCLVTIVVAMRICIRVKRLRRLSLEDYLLLFAWLAYVAGYNTVAIQFAQHGAGTHQWNMTLRQLINYLRVFHVGTILYNVVILPLKLSIIIQVLRAFVPVGARNVTFWLSHALIWMNIIFYVVSTGLSIFSCKPTAKSYDPTIQGGHCLDSTAVNIASASLNSLSDTLLLVLPQQLIWRLSIPPKRKLLLSFAFLAGILGLTCAIVRLVYLINLEHSKDAAYFIGVIGVWSLPEIAFGFLVACLPVICGFVSRLRDSSAANRIRVLLTRIRFIFQKHSSVSSSTHTIKEHTHAPDVRYQYVRPQVSDIEYHELVVRSGNSWVMEVEAQNQGRCPQLVAMPPQTVIRPQHHSPKGSAGEPANSERGSDRLEEWDITGSVDPHEARREMHLLGPGV